MNDAESPNEYQSEVYEQGKVVPNEQREVIADSFDIAAEIDKRNGWKDQLTDSLDLNARDMLSLFGEMWAEVMRWCYANRDSKLVGRRLKVVILCVRPEILGKRNTLQKIADDEGVGVTTIGELVSRFKRDFKGFTGRNMQKPSTCAKKSAARIKGIAAAKKALTQ